MKHQLTEKTFAVAQLSEGTIYLMGLSFILGSLFTIFILILLDFMQRDRVGKTDA